MNQDRLDRNLNRYYQDQKLDPAALERLTQMVRDREGVPFPRRPLISIIAAVAVIAIAASALYLLMPASTTHDEIALEISRQAAIGHNQKLDMEFEADDYRDLRVSMTRLGFEPVSPVRFAGKDLKVLGARYGSIHGQPAVQISLLDPDGEICTLYQVRPVGDLAQVSAASRQIDGLIVELWTEKGLLMVLARPAA